MVRILFSDLVVTTTGPKYFGDATRKGALPDARTMRVTRRTTHDDYTRNPNFIRPCRCNTSWEGGLDGTPPRFLDWGRLEGTLPRTRAPDACMTQLRAP